MSLSREVAREIEQLARLVAEETVGLEECGFISLLICDKFVVGVGVLGGV